MDIIYLDNASTTKPSKEVKEILLHTIEDFYGNPSSLHNIGLHVEKKIKDAKLNIANHLNVSHDELYFTSGGTESNNIAIQGVVKSRLRNYNHIITVKTEHPSVTSTVKYLEKIGCKIDYVAINEKGYVCKDNLLNLIKDETGLISIMHTNNETGVMQNINELGSIIKEKNNNTLFHVDGVQAFGKINLNLKYVDLLSFSSHKIHGLKGIGGLYIRNGVRILPILFGGNQQNSIRPGTENTIGILSLEKAAQKAYENLEKRNKHVNMLKNRLLEVKNVIQDVHINSDELNGSPYILNISFLGVKGEVLLHSLEQDGIYVSTGAACSGRGSYNILEHMSNNKDINTSAIRFSFSYQNTLCEIDKCIDSLQRNVKLLRRFRPS